MKKSRFTEEQITYALKQAEAGEAVTELTKGSGLLLAQLRRRSWIST